MNKGLWQGMRCGATAWSSCLVLLLSTTMLAPALANWLPRLLLDK